MSASTILGKWLAKAGVAKEEDLLAEEKVVYDKYKLILSGEAITVEKIKEFCRSQIRIIESKCDGVTPLTNLQQSSLRVYMKILAAIEAPEAERESLERYLTAIVNS